MEIRVARTCFAIASFSLLLVGSDCGSSNSNAAPPTAADAGPPTAPELGAKYKFSPTTLPGWQLDPNDSGNFLVLQEGTANDLFSSMDGGADTYTNAGCTMSVYEKLVATYPQTATFYAMYMGTDANATTLFNSQVSDNTASDSIPGFDPSVAAGYGALISVTVYAHFGAMFFRLVVTGFTDATSAYAAAGQLLAVFKSKTN
jgi:hypothetical protein